MKLQLSNSIPAKEILYRGSRVIPWLRNFILISPCLYQAEFYFLFKLQGSQFPCHCCFEDKIYSLLFQAALGTLCLASIQTSPVKKVLQQCGHFCVLLTVGTGWGVAAKVKSRVPWLGIYEETQPPPLEKTLHGHSVPSFRATVRGDGPFQALTTSRQSHTGCNQVCWRLGVSVALSSFFLF